MSGADSHRNPKHHANSFSNFKSALLLRSSFSYKSGRLDFVRLIASFLRQRAISGVSASREPEALDLLISVARQDKDQRVRREAVNAIGRSRDPRAKAFLEEVLKQ